jgi:transglutaminase-like putative cysteine protease
MLVCRIKLHQFRHALMKSSLTILLFFFTSLIANAQGFNFGAITHDDYDYDKKKLDSTSNAVVLREFGKGFFEMNFEGHTDVAFIYHVKIKIYNRAGFDQANVTVPLYKGEFRDENMSELKASTFNLVDGKFVETPLDQESLIMENKSKYLNLAKFTLPNIKEGSVIEYTYKLLSPNVFNFKTWAFQSEIPKVYSEFTTLIPAIYNYHTSLRGDLKLSDSKSEIEKKCYTFAGLPVNCSKSTYLMKNIPAFIKEEYMSAPSNYMSAIHFELSQFQHVNMRKVDYTKTWKDIDDDLISDQSFGSQMKRKDLFKNLTAKIGADSLSNLDKAKAVYAYIKKQIKWNNIYGKYATENIKKALETKSGNVADINLSLIAALQAASFDAEALILSTRENGVVNKLYPIVTDFDYVVAKVDIDGVSYLLDATEPLLPFGLLPFRCINDQGRVINLKKPSYWIDLKASQKTTKNYLLNARLDIDGKLTGKLTIHSQGYAALNKRNEIKSFGSVNEFVERLEESMPRAKILSHKIFNLDSIENVLTEEYTIEIKTNNDLNLNQFYFNPFVINSISKNPFNLNERKYPIDLGSKSDDRATITIELPEGFEMLDKPKNLSIALGKNGGKYLLETETANSSITVNQTLQLNNVTYQPEEYLALKTFYSKIIQNQKLDFLVKKTGK